MAYQPNIPAATDALKNSQSDIQGNFQAISTAFDANHGDFNGAIPGQHVVVQMPVNGSTPNPPFAATDVGLFNKVYSVSNISEMYVKAPTAHATLDIYPMTASVLGTTADPTVRSSGWSFLASGILIKWGTVQVTSPNTSASQAIAFPTGARIPAFTTCIQVMISPLLLDGASGSSAWSPSVTYATVTALGFNIRCGFSSGTFNPTNAFISYLAIGY